MLFRSKEQYSEYSIYDDLINEVLSKDASAGDWIHDFVHSDNPKFKGKSKAERKKMALGAYYAKQNEEKETHDDKGEEAEDKAPNFSLDNRPEDVVYFICSGEEKIAGGILRSLEKIKDSKIKVTYILRDENFLTEEAKKQQNAFCKILQNYARSGLFVEMTLVEEKSFKKLFMPQVSLMDYESVFSQTLAKMISMLNWLRAEQALQFDVEPPNEACRVNTMGVFAETEERLIYPLDNVRQKDVYFACTKKIGRAHV